MNKKTRCRQDFVPRNYTQNFVHMIFDREMGIDRRHTRNQRTTQSDREIFYKTKTPNLTIADVGEPEGFIRKFTPNGKYLLVISNDQQYLEVYEFRGVANAASLVSLVQTEYIAPGAEGVGALIKNRIFDSLFKLTCSIRAGSARKPLHREFSICYDDGVHVLLVSCSSVTEDYPNFYGGGISHDLVTELDLFNYNFYVVDINRHKCIREKIKIFQDSITLPNNHGVSVYKNVTAILSVFHQKVYIYELRGFNLFKTYEIGCYWTDLDHQMFHAVPEFAVISQFAEPALSILKQRALAALYRRIIDVPSKSLRSRLLKEFYKKFEAYENLVIYKMQLIDNNILLLRFERNRGTSLGADVKLYVFYDIFESKVVNVYSEDSLRLLSVVTNFCDKFRNIRSLESGRPPSSTANNANMLSNLENLIETIPGGMREAAFRLNLQLPVSTQSFSPSPYLDMSCFHYDDFLVSSLERPKFPLTEPICFNDPETGITLYRLYPGIPPSSLRSIRELVAYIYHPNEPFVITVQRKNRKYFVSFHIYNPNTEVAK